MTFTYDRFTNHRAHRIGVMLVGCGGTGSQVLHALARMDQTLRKLELPGLFVVALDPDRVEEANLGRQAFFPADLGSNKAVTLVTRLNRCLGTDWMARPERVGNSFPNLDRIGMYMNFLITCVDSGPARAEIGEAFKAGKIPFWLDYGNGRDFGQVVLGTRHAAETRGWPTSYMFERSERPLPTVLDLFPEICAAEDDTPSCSMAEAIDKQDLFVNSTLANLGVNILWRLIREGELAHHGAFMNLRDMAVRPIPVSRRFWRRMGWDLPKAWRRTLPLVIKRSVFDKVASGSIGTFHAKPQGIQAWRMGAKAGWDEVRFTNGVGNDRPWARVECRGIEAGEGVFDIRLGEILETGNWQEVKGEAQV